MKAFLQLITDRGSTRKGMWITLGIWIMIAVLLATFAPGAKEYEATSIDSLPDYMQSVIAEQKLDEYFKGEDSIPAILVFYAEENTIDLNELTSFYEKITEVEGIKEIVPVLSIPPQVVAKTFMSEDQSTLIIPTNFDSAMETKELKIALEQIDEIALETTLNLYITGPAGIAVDNLNIFSRADIVLLMSTVGIVLILLILIYRSPLLALIPLIAIGFVYMVVNQLLGLMGMAGLLLSNQSLSIMMILLFAAVTDYSLFVFSRFREELKMHENKYEAMKHAMQGTGMPVFFAGGTVFVAMLILFFAEYRDYQNFAPIFGTTMAVIMISSITLIPALFTLFGRNSFWPKIPRVGDATIKTSSMWSKIGRLVVRKPLITAGIVLLILVISASNMFNIKYEFDMMKSFPEDMPSRVGYELLEEKFESGAVAPTTVILEANEAITEEQQDKIISKLSDQPLVSSAKLNDSANDNKVKQFTLTFKENPYSVEVMDALEVMIEGADQLLLDSNINGKLYFAGETARTVDDRSINNRDIVVIVILESILILILLVILTRSFKMPLYMMATILLSYLAAVGLGMFLSNLFFDISTISNRVTVYSFVFLVALGIDYNIILTSRFKEEIEKRSLKEAVEVAVSTTGGVISSAGVILAATFGVLMTQPVQVLFVFGFIVAIGILLDTFLVRGFLLPSLIVLFEKDKDIIKEDAN